MSNEIVKQKTRVNELQELQKWGELAIKGGILPAGTSVFQAMAIIQTGREIGIPPMQALRSMFFVNGKLAMLVQAQMALARRHGVVVISEKGDTESHEVTLGRGAERATGKYTFAEAVKAGLVRAGSGWEKNREDMLVARSYRRALTKIAPDLVMGLLSLEEARDLPDNGAGILTASVVDVIEAVQPDTESPKSAQHQSVALTEEDLRVDMATPASEPLKTQNKASEPVKRGRPFKLNAMQIQVSNAVKDFCKTFEIADEADFRHDLQRRHGVEHLNLATEAQCIAMIDEINSETNDRMKE